MLLRTFVIAFGIVVALSYQAMFDAGLEFGVVDESPRPCHVCYTEAELERINERKNK